MADGTHNDFHEPPFDAAQWLGALLRRNIVDLSHLTEL